jgi:putative ABC transport system ATP-binding protein
MDPKSQPAVAVEGLTVQFDGQVVLDGLDLTVPAGRRVMITGPSGSGKSTLLRCLLGFCEPHTGRIGIQGRTLNDESVWQLREKLGYVAQEPALGDGTVRRILQRPFAYKANQALAGNLQRVPELFDRFALAGDLLDKPAEQLSGGQKQRVALISALLLDRPILLLDEPASALDPANATILGEYLAGTDKTIIAAGHDSPFVRFVEQTVELPGGGR